MLLLVICGAVGVYIVHYDKEINEAETIVTKCEVIDKDIRTNVISNGKVTSTVRQYYLSIDINGILKEVPVTSIQYNQIEVPCSAMFALYYNSDSELIKAE